MSQIKVEPKEDGMDEMYTTMRNLIEQADWLLDNRGNRSSSSFNSTFDESNANSDRDRMQAYNAGREAGSREPTQSMSRDETSSSSPYHDVSNDSSGSDTTIVCSHDEPGPSNRQSSMIIIESSNSLTPGANRPIGDSTVVHNREVLTPQSSNHTPTSVLERNISANQEVIVIGTPPIESRSRRRAHRTANMPNMNNSVIDLSDYPEMPVVILSSDEENDDAAAAVTIQPSAPTADRSIAFGGYDVSINTSNASLISLRLTRNGNRRNTTQSVQISQIHDARDISMVEPVPAPNHYSVPAPSQEIVNNAGTRASSEGTPKSKIICPICYETLANKRAISTYCGHVYCSNCIQRSLRTAKKCPICNKKLTKASQMHPIYFATE